MNEYRSRYGWALALLLIVLTAAIGAVAYNVGMSHGLAQVADSAGPPPYPYPWHGPWGFGFFPLFPLLFVFFWVLLIRGLWGRPWRHHSYGGPFYRESFDDWHRRAHERMEGKADHRDENDPGRRG